MNISTTPYVEDFKRSLGAVTIALHPEGYQIGGFGVNAFLIASLEELPDLIAKCSANSAAFSVFIQSQPDWYLPQTKVVRTSEPLSLSDLGL